MRKFSFFVNQAWSGEPAIITGELIVFFMYLGIDLIFSKKKYVNPKKDTTKTRRHRSPKT